MGYLSILDILVMGFGVICLIIWMILFFASFKYNSLFDSLDEKEYPLKEVYGTGHTVMALVKYNYKSKFDRKLRNFLSVLYEEKYVEYYLRVIYAQSITYGLIVFLMGFILYGLSAEVMILMICILLSVLAVYYFLTLSEKKIQKRSEELLNDFSEMVSKLALLINAGMIMREAWTEVAYANEGSIYAEMKVSCEDMQNGVSEAEAIRLFGVRCMIPEIKKFSSTIIQGIEKGNRELAMMLQIQSNEIWNMKQQRVRREGAKANTKLMIPMFIMFVGVLIMIIIPIFTNLGV